MGIFNLNSSIVFVDSNNGPITSSHGSNVINSQKVIGILEPTITNRGIQYKIPSGSSNNTVQKDLTPLFLSASNNEVKVGIGTNDPLGSFEITSTTPADITLRTNQDGIINVGEETGRIRFLIESSSFIINDVATAASGASAEIFSRVNEVTHRGVKGSIVFALSKTTTSASIDAFEVGYEAGSPFLASEDIHAVLSGSMELNAGTPRLILHKEDGVQPLALIGSVDNNDFNHGAIILKDAAENDDGYFIIRKDQPSYLLGSGNLGTGKGLLGIGTNDASKTLEISTDSSKTDLNDSLSGAGTGSGVLIRNINTTTNTYANLDFRAHTADGRIAYQYKGTGDKGDFHFIVDPNINPTSRMVIQSEGNVGIGTTTPAANLHVSGNIWASGSNGSITASNIQVDNDIALGGNIFSFSGFSFIEGVSANLSGSTVFGSGSTPSSNDIAGGGTAHQFTGSVAISGSGLSISDLANATTTNFVVYNTSNGSLSYDNPGLISSSEQIATDISGSWQGQNFISQSQTFLSTGQRTGDSVITGSLTITGVTSLAPPYAIAPAHLNVTGHITASGHISASSFSGGTNTTVKADEIVKLQGPSVVLSDGSVNRFTFNVDSTPEIDILGDLIIDPFGDTTFSDSSINVEGNITASGNISASIIYTDTLSEGNPVTGLILTGNVSASGNISSSGDVIGKAIITDTFMGTLEDILVLHANAGSILLRPNGATSPVGMTTIDNAGLTAANLIGTDAITAGGVISSSKVDAEYSLYAHSASLNYVNAGELALPGFSNVSASLAALTAGTVGDNLGNHTATEDLDLATFSIKGITNITASGVISSSKDALINGLTIGRGSGDNIQNTAIGNLALLSSTDSNQEGNTAVGASSMQLSPTGKLNTAVGWRALYQTKANNNTSIGQDSLYNHVIGDNNVALGLEAGKTITGGSTALYSASNSTFIGVDTKAKADDETNQIVIGYDAVGEGSNSVVLGNDSITKTLLKGNVTASNDISASGALIANSLGIGTSSLSQLVHIKGSNPQILLEESPTEFLRLGVEATNGDMCIGWDDEDDLHLGCFGTLTDSTIASKMVISASGNVGIGSGGTSVPDKLLTVKAYKAETTLARFENQSTNEPSGILVRFGSTTIVSESKFLDFQRSGGNPMGSIRGSGSSAHGTLVFEGVATGTTSDIRYKTDITDYTENATSIVNQIDVINFHYTSSHFSDPSLHTGLKAQQIHALWPRAVTSYEGENTAANINPGEDGFKPMKINEGKLVPLLIKTIQELEARIQALEG